MLRKPFQNLQVHKLYAAAMTSQLFVRILAVALTSARPSYPSSALIIAVVLLIPIVYKLGWNFARQTENRKVEVTKIGEIQQLRELVKGKLSDKLGFVDKRVKRAMFEHKLNALYREEVTPGEFSQDCNAWAVDDLGIGKIRGPLTWMEMHKEAIKLIEEQISYSERIFNKIGEEQAESTFLYDSLKNSKEQADKAMKILAKAEEMKKDMPSWFYPPFVYYLGLCRNKPIYSRLLFQRYKSRLQWMVEAMDPRVQRSENKKIKKLMHSTVLRVSLQKETIGMILGATYDYSTFLGTPADSDIIKKNVSDLLPESISVKHRSALTSLSSVKDIHRSIFGYLRRFDGKTVEANITIRISPTLREGLIGEVTVETLPSTLGSTFILADSNGQILGTDHTKNDPHVNLPWNQIENVDQISCELRAAILILDLTQEWTEQPELKTQRANELPIVTSLRSSVMLLHSLSQTTGVSYSPGLLAKIFKATGLEKRLFKVHARSNQSTSKRIESTGTLFEILEDGITSFSMIFSDVISRLRSLYASPEELAESMEAMSPFVKQTFGVLYELYKQPLFHLSNSQEIGAVQKDTNDPIKVYCKPVFPSECSLGRKDAGIVKSERGLEATSKGDASQIGEVKISETAAQNAKVKDNTSLYYPTPMKPEQPPVPEPSQRKHKNYTPILATRRQQIQPSSSLPQVVQEYSASESEYTEYGRREIDIVALGNNTTINPSNRNKVSKKVTLKMDGPRIEIASAINVSKILQKVTRREQEVRQRSAMDGSEYQASVASSRGINSNTSL